MRTERSQELFKRAELCIPGGVNSPVRACRSVGSTPLFIDRAQGAWLYDADGNAFIDYVGSWGPMILGHRHPAVEQAIRKVMERGVSFGAPVDLEVALAEKVMSLVPSLEMIRMVNSGTEATMSALRLARGFTGRNGLVKFDGCYHGHGDSFLVDAGSGVATLSIPGSPGVPDDVIKHTFSIPYNDAETFRNLMAERGKDIAAVIVEPVAGNMGFVRPEMNFLSALRDETEKYGALLIFDEVMTGFRVASGGAQELFGIRPDLSTFGKIIGGGLPVGAYGGRRDIMKHVAPQGPVYQAGTLSGNPLAMAAGLATLEELCRPGFYETLAAKTRKLVEGLTAAAKEAHIPVWCDCIGSMFGLFFIEGPVRNFADARKSDLNRFNAYYAGMREKCIYLAPSQFEAGFVSFAHGDEEIHATIQAARSVLKNL
ncbi:glutamate-1-semialdehyde 2,1-aminomutase [Desulfobotulus sp. H1]|uniref:Glutamate-1-semialdehyde 2,1-aminomutase n=1 Tax=Desulfobotulus pelophilus TaxID=2823377 RepID=A0ABT3NCL7_9BACT|nr:glutamate-1-semialdehyde 2,1-aminomutase [Desulfobotulus pelophilus]MCW7755211.1 glutamate-1-semialdehyde 2,1-aminomutase [Desulfobotulus pelophilus]